MCFFAPWADYLLIGYGSSSSQSIKYDYPSIVCFYPKYYDHYFFYHMTHSMLRNKYFIHKKSASLLLMSGVILLKPSLQTIILFKERITVKLVSIKYKNLNSALKHCKCWIWSTMLYSIIRIYHPSYLLLIIV